MDEVYCGAYQAQAGTMQLVGKESVLSIGEVADIFPAGSRVVGAGDGWTLASQRQITKLSLADCYKDLSMSKEGLIKVATAKYQAGAFCSPNEAYPVYLRDKVAKKA